jgi:hypothetical protein
MIWITEIDILSAPIHVIYIISIPPPLFLIILDIYIILLFPILHPSGTGADNISISVIHIIYLYGRYSCSFLSFRHLFPLPRYFMSFCHLGNNITLLWGRGLHQPTNPTTQQPNNSTQQINDSTIQLNISTVQQISNPTALQLKTTTQ